MPASLITHRAARNPDSCATTVGLRPPAESADHTQSAPYGRRKEPPVEYTARYPPIDAVRKGHAIELLQNELLCQHGINFNDIPHRQRRGTGLQWQDHQKAGSDPRTGTQATATRRTLHVNDMLPVKDEYRALVTQILATHAPASPAGRYTPFTGIERGNRA